MQAREILRRAQNDIEFPGLLRLAAQPQAAARDQRPLDLRRSAADGDAALREVDLLSLASQHGVLGVFFHLSVLATCPYWRSGADFAPDAQNQAARMLAEALDLLNGFGPSLGASTRTHHDAFAAFRIAAAAASRVAEISADLCAREEKPHS